MTVTSLMRNEEGRADSLHKALPRGKDVVLIIDDLGIGGAQRVLDVQLRAMQSGSCSIRVINLSKPTAASEKIRALGIELVEVQQNGLFDLASWIMLRKLIREWRPRVIHAHLTHATIVGAVLARMAQARFVVTIHSQGPDGRGWRGRVKDVLEQMALSFGSDLVVACGPRVATMQANRVGRTPISIIENRVDRPAALSADERIEVRSSLGYRPDDVVVISVGRLTVEKGFDILIRAFRQVAAKFPNAKLVIVGGGDDYARLAQVRDTLSAEQFVKLTGPRSDVARLMAATDAFVLPSLWEGLPMVLLEAMGAGLPVVATDVGDVSTVIKDGAGILVSAGNERQLADSLSEIVSDPDLRTALSERGAAAVKKYTDLGSYSEELQRAYFPDAQRKTDQ